MLNHANADPAELRKFEAQAARWWDPQGDCKPLHDINPLRLGYIERHTPVAGRRVLDVGCGGGILSEGLAALGAEVTAIDLAEAPLAVARMHLLESGLTVDYRKLGAEELARHEPGAFDVVACLELLEHVPQPASTVAACARLAKPGGAVYFSTINRTVQSRVLAIAGAEYVLRLLPRGTHNYRKFIRPSELGEWCRSNRLDIRGLSGLHYNPLTRRYRIGPGVEVNYLVRTERADG